MSNDTISLGVDYDSIEEGTVLIIAPDGQTDEPTIQVEVVKINTILTGDLEGVTAYLVENTNGFRFMIGDGEIVSIVEEEDESE